MREFKGLSFTVEKNGTPQKYRQTIFRVLSRRSDGTPDELRLVADNESAEISEGDWFLTGFLSDSCLKDGAGEMTNIPKGEF